MRPYCMTAVAGLAVVYSFLYYTFFEEYQLPSSADPTNTYQDCLEMESDSGDGADVLEMSDLDLGESATENLAGGRLVDAWTQTDPVIVLDIGLGDRVGNEPRLRKKLVVLDLNGTLIYRQFRPKRPLARKDRPEFVVNYFDCWRRPRLDEFLKKLFEMYDVAVWTSATAKNAKGLIEPIFGARVRDLVFTWAREQCTNVSNTDEDHSSTKDIRKIVEAFPQYGYGDILFVEDGVTKHVRDFHDKVIVVPKWVADPDDKGLMEALATLEGKCRTFEVGKSRKSEKSGTFDRPARLWGDDV